MAPGAELTPEDITRILRTHESTKSVESLGSYHRVRYCPVKYWDTNELAANKPMEDARAEARCNKTHGLLFGIFDGHDGNKCAHMIASRLFYYISICLIFLKETDREYLGYRKSLLAFFNDDPHQYYGENFDALIVDLKEKKKKCAPLSMEDTLKYAFLKLDDDISNEIFQQLDKPRAPDVDISGLVAVVAYIKKSDLYVAGTGDCEAVLGTLTEADGWSAKKMNNNHNAKNREEVKRIRKEHPSEFYHDLFVCNRLLGGIMPHRAFGDYYYKWDKETVGRVYARRCGSSILERLKTPPYLTALPDVFYHQLTVPDKFLILASDGLWDWLSPFEAVWLVGEHMRCKNGESPQKLPPLLELPQEKKEQCYREFKKEYNKVREKNEKITRLKEMLKTFDKNTLDDNAATLLLRYAIACKYDEGKYDVKRLARILSEQRGSARFSRDDITITVIYINTEFLQNPPS